MSPEISNSECSSSNSNCTVQNITNKPRPAKLDTRKCQKGFKIKKRRSNCESRFGNCQVGVIDNPNMKRSFAIKRSPENRPQEFNDEADRQSDDCDRTSNINSHNFEIYYFDCATPNMKADKFSRTQDESHVRNEGTAYKDEESIYVKYLAKATERVEKGVLEPDAVQNDESEEIKIQILREVGLKLSRDHMALRKRLDK